MGGNARLLFPDTFSPFFPASFSLVVSPGEEGRGACDFERHQRASERASVGAYGAVPKVPKTFGDEVSPEVTRIAYYLSSHFTPFSFGFVQHVVPMTREIARSNSG